MDACKIDPICNTDGLPENFSSTNDVHFFGICSSGGSYGCLKVIYNDHTIGFPIQVGSNYNIGPAGQRPAQAFKSFSAHDYGHSPGGVFEKLHIVRQMPKQLVVFTNDVICGCSYDEIYHGAIKCNKQWAIGQERSGFLNCDGCFNCRMALVVY